MSSVIVSVEKPPISSNAARRSTPQLPQKNTAFIRSLPGWISEKNRRFSSHIWRLSSFTTCVNESVL